MSRSAIRRHNDERALQRRLNNPRYWWVGTNAKRRGICRNTGTLCSRWCCRNTRRYYGPSVQECRQVAWLEKISETCYAAPRDEAYPSAPPRLWA